jgi:homoserine dehydrogenase
MDEVSLALGITGTGGVAVALIMYLMTKGVRSKCLAAKMEMSFDVHQVNDQDKQQETLSNLTRVDLEEIIVDIMKKHKRNSVTTVHAANIVIPAASQARQPSFKEIEEMIKDTIHESVRGSPSTRSRSGSEDSHRSHISYKSHHSKGKDDHIIILKEEL